MLNRFVVLSPKTSGVEPLKFVTAKIPIVADCATGETSVTEFFWFVVRMMFIPEVPKPVPGRAVDPYQIVRLLLVAPSHCAVS